MPAGSSRRVGWGSVGSSPGCARRCGLLAKPLYSVALAKPLYSVTLAKPLYSVALAKRLNPCINNMAVLQC